jgi:hypothetical protein
MSIDPTTPCAEFQDGTKDGAVSESIKYVGESILLVSNVCV